MIALSKTSANYSSLPPRCQGRSQLYPILGFCVNSRVIALIHQELQARDFKGRLLGLVDRIGPAAGSYLVEPASLLLRGRQPFQQQILPIAIGLHISIRLTNSHEAFELLEHWLVFTFSDPATPSFTPLSGLRSPAASGRSSGSCPPHPNRPECPSQSEKSGPAGSQGPPTRTRMS